jgi:hypothetical protein
MSDSDADGGAPLLEDQFDQVHPSRKRKAEEEPELTEAERKKARKAKQKAKNKIRNKRKGKEVSQLDLNQELASTMLSNVWTDSFLPTTSTREHGCMGRS